MKCEHKTESQGIPLSALPDAASGKDSNPYFELSLPVGRGTRIQKSKAVSSYKTRNLGDTFCHFLT